jgi:hypothetical protein
MYVDSHQSGEEMMMILELVNNKENILTEGIAFISLKQIMAEKLIKLLEMRRFHLSTMIMIKWKEQHQARN